MSGRSLWRYLSRPERLAPSLHTVAALTTRLLVGTTMLRLAARHLADLPATAAEIASFGVPLALPLAVLLGGVELVAGLGIVVGLGTRLSALVLAAVMAIRLLTSEQMRLVEAAVPGGDFGLLEVVPLVLLMLLLWLAIRGAGRFSVDRALSRRLGAPRLGTDTVAATRVVILGSGFGGMYAAMQLERIFADDPTVEVTVVGQENFLLFTPMLHEVAASDLDLTHIVSAARKLLRHARFVNGEVAAIDLAARTVSVTHGDEGLSHVLPYDHLVLGLGSVTNFYGLPGLEAGAFTMRTLGDAIALRNRLITNMEAANAIADPAERARLLTFVVAGGGFAGVESMAAINDFARETRRYYHNIQERDIRMVLVHSGERILPELSAKLGVYAQDKLTERGVEIRLKGRVKGFDARGVDLGDGDVLPAGTLVWTAGTAPHPLLAGLDLPKEKGRVVVDATMAVAGHPGLWALGDCAVVPDLVRGGTCPPTAQHATRQGTVLGDNIAAVIRGLPPRAFRFRMLGQLAALGRRSGVAQMFGMRFSGFVAWMLWRSIYLMKLPGFERKVRVALDWALDLLFTKDLVKCPVGGGPATRAGREGKAEPRKALAASR